MKKSALLVILLSFSLFAAGYIAQTGITDSSDLTNSSATSTDLLSGQSVEISAGETMDISISGPAGTITLNVTPAENLKLTLTVELSNPNGTLPDDVASVGFYLVVDTNDTDAELTATISFPFDPAVLPDEVDLDDLLFRFYNGTTEEWEGVASVTNTDENTVTAEVSHFSSWTATGSTLDYAHDGDRANVSYGTPVAVDPNATVELVTPSGVEVMLEVNESVEITFDEFQTNPNASIPDDLKIVSNFTHIDVNDSDASFNASITMPYDSSVLPDDFDPEDLKLMYYDGSEWQDVDSLVDTADESVSANTTHFSTWTSRHNGSIPIVEPGAPVEVENGKPVALVPGELLSLVTPSGVMLNLTVNESVQITITENTTNPVGAVPNDRITFDLFLTVELNETTDFNATFSVPIPSDAPDNLNTSSLEMAYYDGTSSSWTPVPSWVETGEVHANTSHFSSWTIFGDETTDDQSDPSDDTTPEDDEPTPTSDISGLPFTKLYVLMATLIVVPIVTRKFRNTT